MIKTLHRIPKIIGTWEVSTELQLRSTFVAKSSTARKAELTVCKQKMRHLRCCCCSAGHFQTTTTT